MASKVMDALIETGQVVRGWLGVVIQEVTEDIAGKYGLEEARGALVSTVSGPAKEAGLEPGDLITEFHDEDVRDSTHLTNLVAALKPGEKVDIKVIRKGKEKKFRVSLAERTEEAKADLSGQRRSPEVEPEWLGVTVQELTDALSQRFGYEGQEGALVSSVDPESPAAELDNPPRRGDLIQEIEFQEIRNLEDYKRVKKEVQDKKSVMMKLRRSGRGSPWYVVIKK